MNEKMEKVEIMNGENMKSRVQHAIDKRNGKIEEDRPHICDIRAERLQKVRDHEKEMAEKGMGTDGVPVEQWDEERWKRFERFLQAAFEISVEHDELPRLKFSARENNSIYFRLDVDIDKTIEYTDNLK
jgi:hypothetical protein